MRSQNDRDLQMAASSLMFSALYWVLPAAIFFVMLILEGIVKKKPLNLIWLVVGNRMDSVSESGSIMV